ncbi:class A beta-lactamase [Solihabitans fulvus]|uniref:Beta-lactamase n=1 Tax=Solihabitans fulvus TaxID=1892852 RepID=A0A5B2XUE2_9PSEU|nr:class A beta-lactamase [Solihabitans fulvus]KAA2266552.1 class A beta-lactamase [Solihabitans fulvus]
MPQPDNRIRRGRLSRRALLHGGLAGLGVALVGCSTTATPPGASSSGASSAPPSADQAAEAAFAALEAKFGGRLGVSAVDTGTGRTVGHRADERFLMCSTHKVFVVAAILALRGRQPGLLDRLIRYDRSQLLSYAPVTSQHVADGMTVSALCEAAITVSDNTAVNLLQQVLGGPAAATAYVRTTGDQVTRLDRLEPDLNVGAPGDERDTTTPAQFAADLRTLALGDTLDPAGRDLLTGWLTAATTGGALVRAGLPAGWRAGDKSGSGAAGEVNDVAVVWPPNHAPLVVTVFTAPTDRASKAGQATVAGAASIAVKALVPAG